MRISLLFAAFAICVNSCTPAAAQPKQPLPIRVIDGDTVQYGKRPVRAVGYDAPETLKGPKGYKCEAERQLGLQAKAYLTDLNNTAGITLRFVKGRDEYGRSLAKFYRRTAGQSVDVGTVMIKAGLAQPWSGRGPKPNWCSIPRSKR